MFFLKIKEEKVSLTKKIGVTLAFAGITAGCANSPDYYIGPNASANRPKHMSKIGTTYEEARRACAGRMVIETDTKYIC